MKHLYIKQNNNVEIVSSDIIEKLYQISLGGLYSTSDLIGNLLCTHAYDDAVTYLTTKFKNLLINVTDGSYIRFADDAVRLICVTNWGDGTGLTTMQASVVASLNSKFNANATIVSFNELSKFINVKTLSIGEFNECSKLQTIDLANVTTLGGGAFQRCTALTSMGDTSGITTLGLSSFEGSGIVSINLSSCAIISNYAFNGCSKLESVVLTPLCKTIGSSAFSDCIKLTNIGNSIGVTTINQYAFQNCALLTTIDLSSCTSIGNNAFLNCTNLVSVGDTSGVTTINGHAFDGCTKLLSLDTSNVITINSEKAFNGCSSLTSVDLRNCTNIGNNTFLNCTSLTSIGDTSKVKTIGSYGPFNNTPNLQVDFNFPSLETINGTCDNSGFTNVVSMGIITTCSGTFKNCSHLLTAIFPETCSYLGGSIVENCTSLKWVKVLYTQVATLGALFGFRNSNNCKIYVPDSLVSSYKTASNWSTYASRIFSLTQFAIDFPNG